MEKLDKLAQQRPVSSSSKAFVQIGLRSRARALESLEKAYDEGLPFLDYIKQWPCFRCLHDEPRFERLAERIGLPA